ncbi:MAG: hypothetical protein K2W95_28305 [Candidatus Obscuribacterales bacterium]|nr:hypothetical protein [Candidatus Obscuribacterales bacterium]
MRTNRKATGASILLIGALCVLLVLIAVATFFISKVIGGSHQLGNAVDAGALNTAKEMLAVSVPLDTAEYIQFREFSDHPDGPPNGLPAGGANINLLNFNRVMAEAALVQANAEAEEGGSFAGTTPAFTNADIIAREANNIALKMRNKLENEFGKRQFLQTVRRNDVSLLTNNTGNRQTSIKSNNYRVGFMEANTWRESGLEDSGATNISMEGLGGFNGQQEFINAGKNVLASKYLPQVVRYRGFPKPADSTTQKVHFLPGYREIPCVNSDRKLIATPLQPFELPHLVSSKYFDANVTPSFRSRAVVPNAVQTTAVVSAAGTGGHALEHTASAINSVLDPAKHPELIFPIAISRGFVVLTNFPGPDIAGVTRNISTTPANNAGTNARDIFDQELLTTAIYYYQSPNGAVFTTDPTLWTFWYNYNVGPVTPGAAAPPNPIDTSPAMGNTHIFGNPLNITIPVVNAQKFDVQHPPSPEVLALLKASYKRDFGDPTQSFGPNQTPPVAISDPVPATVFAKAQVVAARNNPRSWSFDGTNYNADVVLPPLTTGMELYPAPGLSGRFPGARPDKLHFTASGSNSGTPYQLMLQACGYDESRVDLMIKYIAQRCTETTSIFGDADGKQIVARVKRLLNSARLPIGSELFIYHPINKNVPAGTVVLGGELGDKVEPGVLAIGPRPAFIAANNAPDGVGGAEDTGTQEYQKNHNGENFQTDFRLLGQTLNVPGDQGLRGRMFGDNPDQGPRGHNSVRWIASSGRNGCLGVVFFAEWCDAGTYRFSQPQ